MSRKYNRWESWWNVAVVVALILVVLLLNGCAVTVGSSADCDNKESIPYWCK